MGQALVALRRLLGQAAAVDARVDALLALGQRAVWLVTWPGQEEARTLRSQSGQTAMPVFTGLDTLMEAVERLRWRETDGSVPVREVSVRHALRHAIARSVPVVVVDPGAPHELMMVEDEMRSLQAASPSHAPAGPYAIGQLGHDKVREAVQRSSRPPPPDGHNDELLLKGLNDQGVSRVPDVALPGATAPQATTAASSRRPEDVHARVTVVPREPRLDDTARFELEERGRREKNAIDGMASSVAPAAQVHVATQRSDAVVLDDVTLDELAHALRAFPEVEWACVLSEEDNAATLGLRLAGRFYQRLDEIYDALGRVAAQRGRELTVLLLTEQDAVQQARQHGTVFYPGRRRSLMPR